MTLLGLALWAACRKPAPSPEVLPPPPARPVEAPPPTGRVIDGRFVDTGAAFNAGIPEGWEVKPGEEGRPLRAVFMHAETGVRVEVWSYEEAEPRPRPRPGCAWTFEDKGPYQALRVREELLVATCRPHDPRDPHVQGVYLAREGRSWHIETVIPEGQMGPSGDPVAELLLTMRFGS